MISLTVSQNPGGAYIPGGYLLDCLLDCISCPELEDASPQFVLEHRSSHLPGHAVQASLHPAPAVSSMHNVLDIWLTRPIVRDMADWEAHCDKRRSLGSYDLQPTLTHPLNTDSPFPSPFPFHLRHFATHPSTNDTFPQDNTSRRDNHGTDVFCRTRLRHD